jgi:GGDEF domain-containing protein
MKELRNSILLLLFYLIAVLGISLVQYVEYNFVDFEQAFFVLFAITAIAGIVTVPRIHPTIYAFLVFWAGVYGLTWVVLWRGEMLPPQLHVLQLILIEISAGLSYVVGSHVNEVENVLGKLTASTYPSRVLDIREAGERINVEITRSRRFNRPLAVLLVRLQGLHEKEAWKKFESLQQDLLKRFAVAKVGQIISEIVRQTDLVVQDRNGEFVVICPETEMEKLSPMAERICQTIEETMGGAVTWGSASFPGETLSFDDLLQKAKQRLATPDGNTPPENSFNEKKVESKEYQREVF